VPVKALAVGWICFSKAGWSLPSPGVFLVPPVHDGFCCSFLLLGAVFGPGRFPSQDAFFFVTVLDIKLLFFRPPLSRVCFSQVADDLALVLSPFQIPDTMTVVTA